MPSTFSPGARHVGRAANESLLLAVESNEDQGGFEPVLGEDASGFQHTGCAAGIVVRAGTSHGIVVGADHIHVIGASRTGPNGGYVDAAVPTAAERLERGSQPHGPEVVENVLLCLVVLGAVEAVVAVVRVEVAVQVVRVTALAHLVDDIVDYAGKSPAFQSENESGRGDEIA